MESPIHESFWSHGGSPSHHGCFNSKSWSSMTTGWWAPWMGNIHMEMGHTKYYNITCRWTSIYQLVQMGSRVLTHTHVHTYTYIYIHILYIYIHIHIHIHIYTYTYTCTYTYTYTYTYIQTECCVASSTGDALNRLVKGAIQHQTWVWHIYNYIHVCP